MYVYYLVDKNVDVDNVSIKSDRVSMTRNVPVEFFWFIPSTVKETATIISFGNGTEQVLVSRPWWSFFHKVNLRRVTYLVTRIFLVQQMVCLM